MSLASNVKRTIIWFRNDLRLHDNPVLTAAASHLASTGGEHVCLYCFDPRHFSPTPYGSPKTGVYRAKFLLEAVETLRKNLRLLGSDLVVAMSKPEDVIPALSTLDSQVFVHGEVTSEELAVEKSVEKALPSKRSLQRIFGGNMLYHVEDIPFRPELTDVPDTFTPFKEKVEKRCRIRDLLPTVTSSHLSRPAILDEHFRNSRIPTLADLGFSDDDIARATTGLDERGVMSFTGGEDAALQRIQQWMFEEDMLKDYFDVRNGMLGSSYSSKLSPALALGCVSARKVYYEVRRYESTRRISNKSTYWLIFELIWRDFYRVLCSKYGRRIFLAGGAHGRDDVSWSTDATTVSRWKNGMTGIPLVDANMRELAATGWMSNRGRQNVASYLVLDCGIDWRIGADHFESLLLDHDVCSNYGNWNAAAGLTGGRVNRFNIAKQSRDYDASAEYIHHWLPELRNIPAPFVFEPWKLSRTDQECYGVQIGNSAACAYPSPIAKNSASPADGGYPTTRVTHQSFRGKNGDDGTISRNENRRSWNSAPKRGRVQHF